MKNTIKKFLYFVVTSIFFFSCNLSKVLPPVDQQVKNLIAFSKLYGYARFFYPSDLAVNIDWDEFVSEGIEDVLYCKNNSELKKTLCNIFLNVSPSIRILKVNQEKIQGVYSINENTSGKKVVAWQHLGVSLSEGFHGSISARVYTDTKVLDMGKIVDKFLKHRSSFTDEVQSFKTFASIPKYKTIYNTKLVDSIYCEVPLTLLSDGLRTNDYSFCNELSDSFQRIIRKLQLNVKEEKYHTIAKVILAWNVFQHFYPYFIEAKINWERVLYDLLYRIIEDKKYYGDLPIRALIASLKDGHAQVFNKDMKYLGGLPIKVDWIENKVVIIGTNDYRFEIGDVIERINNCNAKEYLEKTEMMISGSHQLKKFRALETFGLGKRNEEVKIETSRNGTNKTVVVSRISNRNVAFFPNIYNKQNFGIKEYFPGIYYINLQSTSLQSFFDYLPKLKEARGIVFDTRAFYKNELPYDFGGLPLGEVVNHIINRPVKYSLRSIPNILYPDQVNVQYNFENQKSQVNPVPPFLKAKLVFINESNMMSYGEMYMEIIDHYKLAALVGDTTAGCDGVRNQFSVMGEDEIYFTGEKVLKHDGSQHHLIGIKPTYEVNKTIKAVKEGRDEYLEKALEVIEKTIKK